MSDKYTVEYLALLRQHINEHFSTDEIRTLCFDMGVDSEELGVDHSPKFIFILNLITYLRRRERLDRLIQACEQARPHVSWRPPDSPIADNTITADPAPIPRQPPEGQERLRIFLCHASEDKPLVRDLHSKLLESDFEPWLDEEKLLGGQDWELEITKAIRKSHVIIVCLSYESVRKAGFVQKEIRFTIDRALEQPEGAIFLIPLKLTPCEMPMRLQPFQWINYYEDNGYEKLLRALRARADKLKIRS